MYIHFQTNIFEFTKPQIGYSVESSTFCDICIIFFSIHSVGLLKRYINTLCYVLVCCTDKKKIMCLALASCLVCSLSVLFTFGLRLSIDQVGYCVNNVTRLQLNYLTHRSCYTYILFKLRFVLYIFKLSNI